MKKSLFLAAPAFAITACSGSETPDDPTQLQAGAWEINMTVTSFEVPGASTEQAQFAADGANVGRTQTSKHCMSPAEAEKGAQGIAESFKQGSCTDETFDMNGAEFEASMQCRIPMFVGKAPVTMVGEVGNEEFQFVMSSELTSDDFPEGTARMNMAINGRRVGDC